MQVSTDLNSSRQKARNSKLVEVTSEYVELGGKYFHPSTKADVSSTATTGIDKGAIKSLSVDGTLSVLQTDAVTPTDSVWNPVATLYNNTAQIPTGTAPATTDYPVGSMVVVGSALTVLVDDAGTKVWRSVTLA